MASVEDVKKKESCHYLQVVDPADYRFRPLLRIVKAAYGIPNSITIDHFIPALRFTHHPLDPNLKDSSAILATVGQIASGLRFPLSQLDREVLNFYEISPGQGTGNFWRIMYLANQANRLLQYKITLKDIRIHFHLQRNNKHNSFAPYFHFVKRKNKEHVVKKMRDSDKLWPDFPVIVKGKWESSEDAALPPLKHKHTVRGGPGYNLDSCGPVETCSKAIEELLALDSEQYTRFARVNDRGDPLPQIELNFDDEGCHPPLYIPRKAQQVLKHHQECNVVHPPTELLRGFSFSFSNSNDDFSVVSATDQMGGSTNASLDLSISSDNPNNDGEYSTTSNAWSKKSSVPSVSSSAEVSIAENLKEIHQYDTSNLAAKAKDGSNLESAHVNSPTHPVEYHAKLSGQALEELEVSTIFFLKRIKQLDELCSNQAEEVKNLSEALKEKNQLDKQLKSVIDERKTMEGRIRELEKQMKLERESTEKISSAVELEHQQALADLRKGLVAEKDEALASQKAKLKSESDAEYEKLKAKYQKEVYEFKAKYKHKFAKAT